MVYPGHGISAQFVQEPKALTNLLWASLFPPTLVLHKYPETLSWDRLGDIQAALELHFAAFSVLTLPPGFRFPYLSKGVIIVTSHQGWRVKDHNGHT